MPTSVVERAVEAVTRSRKALLKYISPNDAGSTGSHQSGLYLPKNAWRLFSTFGPEKGHNTKREIDIDWHDGTRTRSVVTWYGQGTRSEYRLTRFGRGFPHFSQDTVGDLLVLVPMSPVLFKAFRLSSEDDIESFLSSLGIPAFERWVAYQDGAIVGDAALTGQDCVDAEFEKFAAELGEFPTGEKMSEQCRTVLAHCLSESADLKADTAVLEFYRQEYNLFRKIENRIYGDLLLNPFSDIEKLIATANSILNRRKSRAGRALENHVEDLLKRNGVPHEMRSQKIEGKPDIIFPNAAAYLNKRYPDDRLIIVGVKTTCKDRWRQVVQEAPRVTKNRYIFTIQPGISVPQLREMHAAGLKLIVPDPLQGSYPKEGHSLEIIGFERFIKDSDRILNGG